MPGAVTVLLVAVLSGCSKQDVYRGSVPVLQGEGDEDGEVV